MTFNADAFKIIEFTGRPDLLDVRSWCETYLDQFVVEVCWNDAEDAVECHFPPGRGSLFVEPAHLRMGAPCPPVVVHRVLVRKDLGVICAIADGLADFLAEKAGGERKR